MQALESDVWVTDEGTATVRLTVERLYHQQNLGTRRTKTSQKKQQIHASVAGDFGWLGGKHESARPGFHSPHDD